MKPHPKPTNPFPLPDSARNALLAHFFDYLEDRMSAAGCNDMDQSAFSELSADDKMALYAGFLKWDETANPQGWEPEKFEHIMDSSWLRYLRDRMDV